MAKTPKKAAAKKKVASAGKSASNKAMATSSAPKQPVSRDGITHTAKMPELRERPLSPHLSAYNMLQFTSFTSIMHRFTGVVLLGGAFIFVAWLVLIGSTMHCYDCMHAMLHTSIGKAVLIAWVAAMAYHFCNGIRHLAWDAGKGFDLCTAKRSAALVLFSTILLTVLFAHFLLGGNLLLGGTL